MRSGQKVELVLSALALEAVRSEIDLNADPTADNSLVVPGLAAEEIQGALENARSAGLVHGRPYTGDGSMRLWHNVSVSVLGLIQLGMWPGAGPVTADRR